jgi:hypothetical protein
MDKDYGMSYFKRFIESHEPEDLAIGLALGVFTSFTYLAIRKRMKK